MKNFIQQGHYLSVPAPSGGALTGEGLLSGNIFGVVAYSAEAGELLELALIGVFALPKGTAAVLTVGARVAWDNTRRTSTCRALGVIRWELLPKPPETAQPASLCGWMVWRPWPHDSVVLLHWLRAFRVSPS